MRRAPRRRCRTTMVMRETPGLLGVADRQRIDVEARGGETATPRASARRACLRRERCRCTFMHASLLRPLAGFHDRRSDGESSRAGPRRPAPSGKRESSCSTRKSMSDRPVVLARRLHAPAPPRRACDTRCRGSRTPPRASRSRDSAAASRRSAARRRTPATGAPCRGSRC